ncbi:unnamed protein product [Cylicocyclus nassatus]|uniref:Uncharacterized protein n=1 Tax=Cylicocyclus nassatus TaxID=53992 RepID=A0AA36GRJ5_CYLNA|nr:unnamed protein product [Cylicocyclus nassatus]
MKRLCIILSTLPVLTALHIPECVFDKNRTLNEEILKRSKTFTGVDMTYDCISVTLAQAFIGQERKNVPSKRGLYIRTFKPIGERLLYLYLPILVLLEYHTLNGKGFGCAYPKINTTHAICVFMPLTWE